MGKPVQRRPQSFRIRAGISVTGQQGWARAGHSLAFSKRSTATVTPPALKPVQATRRLGVEESYASIPWQNPECVLRPRRLGGLPTVSGG